MVSSPFDHVCSSSGRSVDRGFCRGCAGGAVPAPPPATGLADRDVPPVGSGGPQAPLCWRAHPPWGLDQSLIGLGTADPPPWLPLPPRTAGPLSASGQRLGASIRAFKPPWRGSGAIVLVDLA